MSENKPKDTKPSVKFVHYEPLLGKSFRTINEEWLSKYYYVTNEDLEILNNPQRIIDSGGIILFAKVEENVAGTAALLKLSDEEAELIKMGVSEIYQGLGIGKALLHAIIDEAYRMGFKKILLETAMKLEAALSLYKQAGFVQTSAEEKHPLFGRITFKMEKVL